MNITRTQAVALFTALSFKTAEKWNDARLNAKLAIIHDGATDEEVAAIADKDTQVLAKKVIEARKNDEAVTVQAEAKETKASKKDADDTKAEKPAKTGKKEKAEKAPAEKAEKPAKKDKPAKKTSAETDKWGSRVGTSASKINGLIGKKWISIADLAKEAGCTESRVRPHIRTLTLKKHVEFEKDKGVRAK